MPSQLDTPEVWGVSAAIYLLSSMYLLYGVYENYALLKRNHPTMVLSLFFLAQFLRAVWMISKVQDTDDHVEWKLASRLSTLLQLTAVSCMVFRWMKTVLMFSSLRDKKAVDRAKIFFIVLNFVFYVGILATTRAQKNNAVDEMYRINSFLLTLSFFVIFLSAIVYGKKLRNTISNPQARVKAGSTSSEKEAENIKNVVLPKIIATSWSLFICFSIRTVVYSYTPITGNHSTPWQAIDTIIYPLCFYQIPELIPAGIIGWSFLSSVHKDSLKVKFSNFKNGFAGRLSNPLGHGEHHRAGSDHAQSFNPFTSVVK
jgi:hypothetical protein